MQQLRWGAHAMLATWGNHIWLTRCWMDVRLTRPVSLGLRALSSDGFKATLPYVTHHFTLRSAVLHVTHLGFDGFGDVGQLQHQSGPSPAIIHPTKGVGRGYLNKLSLSFPCLTPWKRSRERALGARAISRATSGKTHARTRAVALAQERALLMETSKNAQSYMSTVQKKIAEIDSSKALTRRNQSENVSAKCGRVYCCGYGVVTFRPQAKQKRWAVFTRNWRRKQIRSKCAFRCHIMRDPHAQVTMIYAYEMSANWTCTNKLTTAVSQLSKDRMAPQKMTDNLPASSFRINAFTPPSVLKAPHHHVGFESSLLRRATR